MRRLALAAGRLVLRRPILLAWLILAAVLASGVVEVQRAAAQEADTSADTAACATPAEARALFGGLPGHRVMADLDPGQIARAAAWLVAQDVDTGEVGEMVLVLRADGAVVVAFGPPGCVRFAVVLPPFVVAPFVTAMDGTPL